MYSLNSDSVMEINVLVEIRVLNTVTWDNNVFLSFYLSYQEKDLANE